MISPESKYQKRVQKYADKLEFYNKKSNAAGNSKLLVFFAGAAVSIALYVLNQYILMLGLIIIFTIIFIYLARHHNILVKNKNYISAMLQINQMNLKRVQGQWVEFNDTGEEFENHKHNYTYDLDIFGKGSLFQMINMTSTYTGRHTLAGMLQNPLETGGEIVLRQEAVAELSGKLIFRHKLLSNSLIHNRGISLNEVSSNDRSGTERKRTLLDTINKLEEVYTWSKEKNSLYASPYFQLLIMALPVVSIIILILAVYKIVPAYLPVVFYAIQFFMLGYKANYRNKSFEVVEKYSKTLKIYVGVLKQFESHLFKSQYINGLQKELKGKTNVPAWKQINALSKLWESIANRYNFLHLVVNTATLWDFHCLVSLEKWKEKSGKYIKRWFDIIGEVEALCSISVMKYDNPDFIFPEITNELSDGITAVNLGHPLLGKGRKCNDAALNISQPIMLITGSNMSGKSTFLRTVAISLILSYVGAPVCAGRFTCSVLKVYACMRTSDDLGQNVSSFYAELLRVKMIVDAVGRGERVFFLLDEIFKGTNSADRHTGARILINQLDKKGAWGMVSTHDLELADLEKESMGQIRNFNFREYYSNDQIHFDYKLRQGVSDTRNAIYLMKMAGINPEDIN